MEKIKVVSTEVELFTKLLVSARIINEEQLSEAMSCSKRLDVSLDRAISMLKLASHEKLKPAMQAKEMISSGQISLKEAIHALELSGQHNISFEDALPIREESEPIARNDETIDPPASKPINYLAQLLLAAKILTHEQLNQATQKAAEMNLPLGKSLVVNRFINRWVFGQVLAAANLVNEKKITGEIASKLLQETVQHKSSFVRLLFESGNYTNASGDTLTLPELLVMAECLTEADYQDIEEHKLTESKPYLQIISENKLVESNLLDAAVSLIDMIGTYLRPFQAAEALKQVSARKIVVYQAIAELKPPPQAPQPQLRLGELLVEAGIVGREPVEEVLAKQDPNSTLVRIGKKLLEARLLDDNSLYNALRCQSAFREGVISAKQAVAVLSCSHDEKLKLEDAFARCGVFAPIRMQWNWQ